MRDMVDTGVIGDFNPDPSMSGALAGITFGLSPEFPARPIPSLSRFSRPPQPFVPPTLRRSGPHDQRLDPRAIRYLEGESVA